MQQLCEDGRRSLSNATAPHPTAGIRIHRFVRVSDAGFESTMNGSVRFRTRRSVSRTSHTCESDAPKVETAAAAAAAVRRPSEQQGHSAAVRSMRKTDVAHCLPVLFSRRSPAGRLVASSCASWCNGLTDGRTDGLTASCALD
jgi:hypothetical protein